MQLHPIKPHGTEGIAKRTPDPLNIKNSKKPPLGAFYKGNFLQFFACFSPCARIMRLRRKQTMTFWWVNYDVLVGNYDILVGLCGVLCFFNYDVTQSFVIISYLCTQKPQNSEVMKQYSHDYTKVSEAESHLYAAQQLNAHDDPIEAWKHIEDARRLLQEYLAQDNMVEDDDVADGWVKAHDVEELINGKED